MAIYPLMCTNSVLLSGSLRLLAPILISYLSLYWQKYRQLSLNGFGCVRPEKNPFSEKTHLSITGTNEQTTHKPLSNVELGRCWL